MVSRRDFLKVSGGISAAYLLGAGSATGLTLAGRPLGWAPFPIGPSREPLIVSLAYGSEKDAWLREAVARFAETDPHVSGQKVTVALQPIGSRELVTDLVRGALRPVAVSPASSIQVELLRHEWGTRTGGQIVASGADAPQPLVLTPLVLVAWEERARALWPNGTGRVWHELHDALVDPRGWATRGHPEWGFVKFGHTSPLLSNSGLQTLLLLVSAYHDKTRDLSVEHVLDRGFQVWLEGIERGVLEFGDTTGTFMTNMVLFGPSKYDLVAVYENLAIQDVQAARGRWGPIQVYYPPATTLSDHPYAVLEAPWVSAEQRQAAAALRDFLLGDAMQSRALAYGFRPANPRVALIGTDPDNPFNKYADTGIRRDIAQAVATPPADVLNALIDLWQRRISR